MDCVYTSIKSLARHGDIHLESQSLGRLRQKTVKIKGSQAKVARLSLPSMQQDLGLGLDTFLAPR
jgi:hypothetical protein